MTSDGVTRRTARRRSGTIAAARGLTLLAACLVVVAGCGRAILSDDRLPPTHIPQPTPDPAMADVIRGKGSPVIYLPPLEINGSPTPGRAAVRPTSAPANTRAAPKRAAPVRETAPVREAAPAREPAPVREAAPAPKPAPANPAPKPAPTAVRPAVNSGGNPGSAPAIINPNTVMPGGPVRPNPAPGR